jgi:hypothetical protein
MLQQLTDTLTVTLAGERTDSPIFKMLPMLQEVDPASVQILPPALAEEVERATAAKAAGWLRLLSQEVETRRFQWLALRAIGRAQWDIGDAEGASRTYQKLVDHDPDDLDANDALANLYERQYRSEKREVLLVASDQAISRILASKRATQQQRTEALSLTGRNAKTRWRQGFEGLSDVAERRKAAVNRQLIQAYNSYMRAYSNNLNHYWSGLAALQMSAIAKSLADEETWEDAFDDERNARDTKSELLFAFDQLKGAVKLAVQAAQNSGSSERIWADISSADLLFLTEDREARVKRAYKDAVPPTPWFVGAAKGQLELFARLGIRTELAEAIIADLESRVDASAPGAPPSIIIVAGHRIDEPGRREIRFPESAVPAVRQRLLEKLTRLNQSAGGVRVLASAAPGTDIICHELCRELGIKSTICLPMPTGSYSAEIFKDLDAWRSRFLALIGGGADYLQLSDVSGLPKWLQGTKTDEWERGNRWVLQLALSAGAPKVSLIAVWDGTTMGDAKGGTAHMVQIARAAGTVDIDLIPLKDGAVVNGAP